MLEDSITNNNKKEKMAVLDVAWLMQTFQQPYARNQEPQQKKKVVKRHDVFEKQVANIDHVWLVVWIGMDWTAVWSSN